MFLGKELCVSYIYILAGLCQPPENFKLLLPSYIFSHEKYFTPGSYHECPSLPCLTTSLTTYSSKTYYVCKHVSPPKVKSISLFSLRFIISVPLQQSFSTAGPWPTGRSGHLVGHIFFNIVYLIRQGWNSSSIHCLVLKPVSYG